MAKKGFTLMELLIVISLLSILGTLLFMIINPNRQVDKAKEAKAKSEVRMIKQAIITYFDDHKDYPIAGVDFCTFASCSGLGDWYDPFTPDPDILPLLSPAYMPWIEKDPWGREYEYDKNYNNIGGMGGTCNNSWSYICSAGPSGVVESDNFGPSPLCGRPGYVISDDICVWIEEAE